MTPRKIICYLLALLVLVFLGMMVCFQLPSVQTKLAHCAVELIKDKIDGKIEIGSIHIKFVNTLLIKDISIIDGHPYNEEALDTLFHADVISARFSISSLITGSCPVLKKFKIKNGRFNLVTDDRDPLPANITRIFNLMPKEQPQPFPTKAIVLIRRVEFENMAFAMQNFAHRIESQNPWNVNWSDLDVKHINLKVDDFGIWDGKFHGTCRALSFEEKSGWRIEDITAKVQVGQGAVILDDVLLKDAFGSRLDFDYQMLGNSECYKDFLNKVCLVGDFRNARLSLATLARVIPPLNPDSTTFATLTGRARGPVARICGDSLSLGFEKNGFHALVNAVVSGLPEVRKMNIDSDIEDFRFSTSDVTALLKAIAPRAKVDLSHLAPGVVYSGNIRTSGVLDDFHAKLDLNQGRDNGNLTIEANMANLLSAGDSRLSFDGHISSTAFDLKPIFGKELAENIGLDTDFKLKLPFGDSPLEISADSLNINNLRFNRHNYSGIRCKAGVFDKDLNVDIKVRDSALVADIVIATFDGLYKLDASVNYADLHMMNFDKRELSVLAADVKGSLGQDLSALDGRALISDIRLRNEIGLARLGNISLKAGQNGSIYDLSIGSEALKADFSGNRQVFNSTLTSGDIQSLLSFIKPGLYLEKGTTFSATRDSTGYIKANLHSGRLALNENYIRKLDADINGPADSLVALIKAENIHALGMDFKKDSMDVSLHENTLSAVFNYCSTTPQQVFEGRLDASVRFPGNNAVEINVFPSYMKMTGNTWEFPASSAKINGKEIEVDNFMVRGKDNFLRLDGSVSEFRQDSLKADIHNMDMALLNYFITEPNFNFQGNLNARGAVISPIGSDMPKILLWALADSLKVKGVNYGSLLASSEYEHDKGRFKINVLNDIRGNRTLDGNVFYKPSDKSLEIGAKMDRFPFGGVGCFLESVFSDMDGYASGDVSINSKHGKLDVSCPNGRIDNGLLKIAFTHVPYYIDGPFRMDNNGIHLGEVKVHDRFNGAGTAEGGLSWNRMKDMRMDIHLFVKDIEALAIPANIPGSVFYGNVTASGKVDITGPFNKLLMTANAMTTGPSNMHFIINDDLDASKGELLSFVDPRVLVIDPYDTLMTSRTAKKAEEAGFTMKIKAEADQNFTANLDMTGTGFAAGAAAVGKGIVDLDIDTGKGDFSILGDYVLQEGTFDFNASNIVHRQFSVTEGSTIKFKGDIDKTELKIKANYQTKASIASLISDTTSVSNRRNVLCGIDISDKLTDPKIKFSIDIPDLDPTTKTAVESALNTDAKVQKQFLSLLISSSFLPDEQSGIVNNSSILYSNVSELMANQINNIFNKLDIPVDLGMNFQPNQNGENLFDVAISTQLWNNRVIIGGSIGNRQSTSSSNSAIFGDFDIEYKVTRNGAFRIKAFSHAADQYSNNLDQGQRNGLGFTWQQEFDNFCRWVKYLFLKKDEKLKLQEDVNKTKLKTTTLTIDE